MWRLEQAVLMIVMENPRLAPILIENIGTDLKLFKHEDCKKVYLAIIKIHEKKEFPFLVSVMEEVGVAVPESFYVSMGSSIQGIHPSGYHKFLIETIGKIIWENKKKSIMGEILQEIQSNIANPGKVVELAKKLQVREMVKESGDFQKANKEYIDWSTQGSSGIDLGIPCFDKAIDYLNMGEVMLICGRPTTGKSWMALNIIENMQKKTNHLIGLFSIEMAKPAVVERMKQIYYGTSRYDLKERMIQGNLDDTEFLNLYESMMIYTHSYSVSEISRIIKEELIEIVFIDFLNIIKPETQGKRYEKTTQVILDLKIMAKEMNVLVVILAQLSRLAGDGSIPVTMDMIRDSGAIEEVADFIIGISRKDIAGIDVLGPTKYEEEKDILYTALLKNKRGSSQRVKLHQDPTSGKIREIESRLEYPV